MKSIDFEHGLLGKVFNLSSDARTNIKGHDALLLENAEYRKLFSEFTQASQKMFKGMDPHKYDDQPHIKEWAIFFKNILRNPGARTAASQAASKLHEIYETHNAKLSAAHAADNLTNALASKRYD
ncbi:MAG TPA: hypothetical protein VHP34_10090, partial [Alphaproteobacteria bacterium]|nr:hypothetical protein [Alphaproteobacteria bacterium]